MSLVKDKGDEKNSLEIAISLIHVSSQLIEKQIAGIQEIV